MLIYKFWLRIDEMPDDLNAPQIQEEVYAASGLLMELQAKIDSISNDHLISYLQ